MVKKSPVFLLTTEDNPYSPFDQWYEWYQEDVRLGYDTCGLLARLCYDSEVYNEDSEIEAMREIVEFNVSGKHIMVTKQEFNELIKTPN